MDRLILQMQSSMDGYVASTVPGSQWQLWDWGPNWPWTADLRAHFNERLRNAAGIVLSRPMVNEGYLAHWSRVAAQHDGDPDFDFARRIQQLPKFVLSVGQEPRNTWPATTVLHGPLAETVEQAKHQAGGDVVCFGGATFAKALLHHGLVDELELYTNPGIAGAGTSIFDSTMSHFRYRGVASTSFTCGIVVTRWATVTREE